MLDVRSSPAAGAWWRTRFFQEGVAAVLALALLGLAAPAQAQPAARVIGVMSLIADEFVVVGQEGTTGTKLDQNVREPIPIKDGSVERVVVAAAMRAVAAADASSKVMPMLVNEPRYYRGQSGWIDGDKAELPAELLEALRSAGMTHLLLVTKHRAAARLTTGRLALGSGRLEGIGFYVDRQTPLVLEGTSRRTVGFLAPYIYARLTLVDLTSSLVTGKREIMRGEVVTASQTGASGGDPWSWLDERAKFQAVAVMIEQSIGQAVLDLVRPR